VQGHPVLLIYKGNLLKSNLEKVQLSVDELEEAVREHGVTDFSQVDQAIMEVDGNISIISDDYKHHTIKKRKLRNKEGIKS
jgi:uncharacterized membrane protein YcaP (DUF421 family)